MRKWSGCDTNALIGSIKDGIKALQPSVSVGKVEPIPTVSVKCGNDQVKAMRIAANSRIEETRP